MAEQYLAEIRMFGGNFAPRAWALCDGQLLPIAQNQALFSLLGTTFGGDGRTTFALPDMRGRVAMHAGSGPGLTPRSLGQRFGEEDVTLNQNQIPSHNHFIVETVAPTLAIEGNAENVTTNEPATNQFGAGSNIFNGTAPEAGESLGGISYNQGTYALNNTGGGRSHTNMAPIQVVNYIICLQGLFPSRS
ncbi:MAG: tail fiber protein [Bacteroidota bacterium]